MILPEAKILEESLVAAELPQGLPRTAFGKSVDDASDKERKPGRHGNVVGKGGGENGCGHGLISNGLVLSPFSVPLLSLSET
jgi:hypothetical protein